MNRHQDECGVCAGIRERAPASDPEDCPDLARLQNLEAVRLMGGGPVRPSPSLVNPDPATYAARRRAALAHEPERQRAGKE